MTMVPLYSLTLWNKCLYFITWKIGSNCSSGPIASDLPTIIPSLSTPKYLPYPDFKAILVSLTIIAVKISSGKGPSPIK